MDKRLYLIFLAAWLFIPPMLMPSGAVLAQQPLFPIAVPHIERFDLDPPQRLAPGQALIFRISGSPRGDAAVKIDGVKGKVALNEVFSGVYEGVYTIVDGDQVVANSVVIGTLRVGSRERSTVLDQPLVDTPRVASSALSGRRTYQ